MTYGKTRFDYNEMYTEVELNEMLELPLLVRKKNYCVVIKMKNARL